MATVGMRRVLVERNAKRPPETAADRIAWLLGVRSPSRFNRVSLGQVDYRGRTAGDVIRELQDLAPRRHIPAIVRRARAMHR